MFLFFSHFFAADESTVRQDIYQSPTKYSPLINHVLTAAIRVITSPSLGNVNYLTKYPMNGFCHFQHESTELRFNLIF